MKIKTGFWLTERPRYPFPFSIWFLIWHFYNQFKRIIALNNSLRLSFVFLTTAKDLAIVKHCFPSIFKRIHYLLFLLKSSENRTFSDDFKGIRNLLNRLSLLNNREKIWERSLFRKVGHSEISKVMVLRL